MNGDEGVHISSSQVAVKMNKKPICGNEELSDEEIYCRIDEWFDQEQNSNQGTRRNSLSRCKDRVTALLSITLTLLTAVYVTAVTTIDSWYGDDAERCLTYQRIIRLALQHTFLTFAILPLCIFANLVSITTIIYYTLVFEGLSCTYISSID